MFAVPLEEVPRAQLGQGANPHLTLTLRGAASQAPAVWAGRCRLRGGAVPPVSTSNWGTRPGVR